MLLLLTSQWLTTSEIRRITSAKVYEDRVLFNGRVARYVYEDAVSYGGNTFPLQKRWRGKRLYVRADQLAPILVQMGGRWFWDSERKRFFKGKPSIRFIMGKDRKRDLYVITITSRKGAFKVSRGEDSVVVSVRGLYGKFWKIVGDGDFVSFVRVEQRRKETRFIIHLGARANGYEVSKSGDTLRVVISKIVPRRAKRITVVIDPGHGGRDAGAVGNGYKEKDINLSVALKVAKILRARGYRVLLTRKRDEYVSLYARARMANRSGAHLFVSIHCNASRDRKASGMETYFLSESRTSQERAVAILENSAIKYDIGYVKPDEPVGAILGDLLQNLLLEQSYNLALSIHRSALRMALTKDRGVRQAGFYVLKWVMMPSVLVELGFITNRREAKKLANPSYQRKLARAIASGIEEYISKQQGGK